MVIAAGDTFETEVRGESHYQDAITACVDAFVIEQSSDLACHAEFDARLVREPENRHDANAIAVTSIGARTLGYLPRELAVDFAPTFDLIGGLAAVQCRARAYGRRDGPSGSWNFGIWLDLPDPDDLAEVLTDLDSKAIAEMKNEGGLVRVRDEDSGALTAPSRSATGAHLTNPDYDPAGEMTDAVVAVTAPPAVRSRRPGAALAAFGAGRAKTMFGSSRVIAATRRARSMAQRLVRARSRFAAASAARRTPSRSKPCARSPRKLAGRRKPRQLAIEPLQLRKSSLAHDTRRTAKSRRRARPLSSTRDSLNLDMFSRARIAHSPLVASSLSRLGSRSRQKHPHGPKTRRS
jgi:hypothetical protein